MYSTYLRCLARGGIQGVLVRTTNRPDYYVPVLILQAQAVKVKSFRIRPYGDISDILAGALVSRGFADLRC